MSQGPFRQTDDEFWSSPLKNLSKVAEPYRMESRRALVIDGPRVVDLGARKTLPVSLYYNASQPDIRKAPFHRVAVVVATRSEDRKLLADFAQDRPGASLESPTSEPDSTVFVGDSHVLDLRRHPGLPWSRGVWSVRVIVQDFVSNRIEITLADSTAGNPDGRRAPAVPDSQGIVLGAAPPAAGKPGLHAQLSGNFRLAPLPGELVPGTSQDQPLALIPITLVMMGTSNAFPLSFVVTAPAFGKPGDAELTGHFLVDLPDVPHFDKSPQTYYVYAFAGDVMAGPQAIAITAK